MNVGQYLLKNLWLFPHTSLEFQHRLLPSCHRPKLKQRVIHRQINNSLHFISHWKELKKKKKNTTDFHINHSSLLFLYLCVPVCVIRFTQLASVELLVFFMIPPLLVSPSVMLGNVKCYGTPLPQPPWQRHIKSLWRIFEMERGKRLRERFSTAMNFNKDARVRYGTISTQQSIFA